MYMMTIDESGLTTPFLLFSGDCIFKAGLGKFFEGDAA
jgi:hypothetical protein